MLRTLGIVLIVAGLLALVYGGFSYTRQKRVLDAGPIHARVDQSHHVSIPPIAGAAALVVGVAMIAIDRRGNSGGLA